MSGRYLSCRPCLECEDLRMIEREMGDGAAAEGWGEDEREVVQHGVGCGP